MIYRHNQYPAEANHNPAETKPCNVTIPITILSSSITGKNWTGDGGASIFFMASTAIASGPIVLGFLKSQDQRFNINILLHPYVCIHRAVMEQASQYRNHLIGQN